MRYVGLIETAHQDQTNGVTVELTLLVRGQGVRRVDESLFQACAESNDTGQGLLNASIVHKRRR